MPVLPLSSRTAWHRQVASSKASQCFAEGNADGFPRTQLAQLTESYIAKKKLEPQSPECDCHLDGLVLEHAEREGGFREIAILACLRSFSKFAAVDTLSSLRGDALEQPSFSKYLRCLIFAHHVAPAYVSETELKIAEALVKIRSGRGDPLASFCQAVVHHGTIANSVLLPSPYVNKLLDFCRFRQAYEAHLNLMRSQRRLMSLHNTVSWMRTISNLPFSETATEILRAQVPLWSLWQTWRPNYLRLMQWEGGRFTRRQKQRLAYVFDLEGPDTTGSGHATFKDAVPACFGSIRLSAPDASLIKRVLDTLDHAQRVGESAVDLFIHLCVDNAAGEESLSLAMEFLGSDDDSCCKAAQGLFAGLVPGADFSDRLVALTNGLPFLGSNTSARARLAATIVEDVTNTMCAAQEAYCTMLKDGIGESLATTICVFGAVILEAAWLLESLPAPVSGDGANLPLPRTASGNARSSPTHVQGSPAHEELPRSIAGWQGRRHGLDVSCHPDRAAVLGQDHQRHAKQGHPRNPSPALHGGYRIRQTRAGTRRWSRTSSSCKTLFPSSAETRTCRAWSLHVSSGGAKSGSVLCMTSGSLCSPS